jgi:hypothetical protein
MCKNMTRTSLFNLTYLDIDMLGDTSTDNRRASSFYCKQILPGFFFEGFLQNDKRRDRGRAAAPTNLILSYRAERSGDPEIRRIL